MSRKLWDILAGKPLEVCTKTEVWRELDMISRLALLHDLNLEQNGLTSDINLIAASKQPDFAQLPENLKMILSSAFDGYKFNRVNLEHTQMVMRNLIPRHT